MSFHVITPAYNSAATIAETIESVLAQTDGGWRYWIVDDGSTDETAAVVERYLEDPRIRLIRQENRGVAGALNRGLDALQESPEGDLVALLGSDDIWRPDYLHDLGTALAAHPGWGLAWCEMECFGGAQGRYRGDRPPVVGQAADTVPRIFTDITFLGSAVVCRAGYFRSGLRFPEQFRVMEDVHVWAAIAAQSTIGHVDRPLVRYRIHEGSLSTSSGAMLRNHADNVASYRQLYRSHRRWISRRRYRQKMWWCHHYAADASLRNGRRGLGPTLAALWYRPLSRASWKNLAKGLLGRATPAPAVYPQGGGA